MATEAPADESVAAENVETTIGDTPAAATTDTTEALRWFEIVEVPEADFRAFVRLPNDYQHKDIREKAMAAKARRIRALRNVNTDAWEVLDFEMSAIAAAEGAVDNLVFELLMDRDDRDRYDAINTLNERDEYQLIRQDQERFRELQTMLSDQRPAEEWESLVTHLAGYARALQEEVEEIQKPRREALTNLGLENLMEKVRERRIDAEGRRAFADTYMFWQTYVGTLKIPEGFDPEHITNETMPRQRLFGDESELREIDPLVGVRLQDAFDLLEGSLATLTSGNS